MSKNNISELEALKNLKKVYIESEEKIIENMKETEISTEDLAYLMNLSKEKFMEFYKPQNSNFGFYKEAMDILEKIKKNKK